MRKKCISILFVLSLASGLTAADQQLELAAPFTDNAILQRESSVPVWGWDVPGSKITVQFAWQTKATVAGKNGDWMEARSPEGFTGRAGSGGKEQPGKINFT